MAGTYPDLLMCQVLIMEVRAYRRLRYTRPFSEGSWKAQYGKEGIGIMLDYLLKLLFMKLTGIIADNYN